MSDLRASRLLKYEARLIALRQELARRKLDGFIIPRTDEHMSEYVGTYAERLAWLTGFRGSAALAVVLQSEAAIFIDGRYTLQMRQQVDERQWSYQPIPQTNVAAWLGEHAPERARIGYDPWLHTKGWVMVTRAALAKRRAELIAVDTNPIDAVWCDQPFPSDAKLVIHTDAVSGKNSAEKRRDIAEWLIARRADAVVLSALDSIAWTFNVRGEDIPRVPVALAFALVHADGTADLFVAPEKQAPDVQKHLGDTVRLHSRYAFVQHLGGLENRRIAFDPERAPAAIFEALEAAGANVVEARDPTILPKAIKNSTEITGHKAAQTRDGAALARFLHWLSIEVPKGGVSESSAAARLLEFRQATGKLRDLSFDTISSFGPNGAIVHYRVTEETNRPITAGSLYLIDSGGQYVDGTTDVTRTVAIGTPSAEMRDYFTRVLKGHIALASAVFPAGTRGSQLDTLARQYLWAVGCDYPHGTGHGVGAYLCVHEGPQRVTKPEFLGGEDEPLEPGMIISNEPGYYKAGDYGIRIENLMLVVKHASTGAERAMLAFEMLTFAPIDRTLIDVAMLTTKERACINSYHGAVARIVGPQLEGAPKAWLLSETQPLH